MSDFDIGDRVKLANPILHWHDPVGTIISRINSVYGSSCFYHVEWDSGISSYNMYSHELKKASDNV